MSSPVYVLEYQYIFRMKQVRQQNKTITSEINIDTYTDVYIHTCVHTFIQTYILYKHTYTYTNTQSYVKPLLLCLWCVVAGGADLRWLSTALVMLGKGGITASFASVVLYSPEVFPTNIRCVHAPSHRMPLVLN